MAENHYLSLKVAWVFTNQSAGNGGLCLNTTGTSCLAKNFMNKIKRI